jgi:Protein of unknown function (DUF3667)
MGSPGDDQATAEIPAETGPEHEGQWACPTCNAWASAPFCQNCGEKKPDKHDLSVSHFLSHAGELFFNWDSKIFRSLLLLFTKPGYLAYEYARGCRKRYVNPVQLFFITNLIYFLLYPWLGWSGLKTPLNVYRSKLYVSYADWASRLVTHREAAKGISDLEFRHAFDHVIDVQARSLVFVMVPVFAVALWLLEYRKRRFYGEHLVFSFHLYAFWLITCMVFLPMIANRVIIIAARHGTVLPDYSVDRWLGFSIILALGAYLFMALRRFYGDTVLSALAKAVVLSFAASYILSLYRLILFLSALYST